ncbi:MAG: hypothetical protein ACYTEQ_09425 [Planctomycetota bacterium]|jgi:hypothetical protein
MPDIRVRSRIRNGPNNWATEWMENAKSWRAAWAIVDSCYADRAECRKWSIDGEYPTHFLDIGGAQERQEQKARLARLLNFPSETI